MKKILFLILTVVMVLSFAVPGMALQLYKGSIPVSYITVPATASAASVSGSCVFYGIIVQTDGTNNVTLNVYDNTAASGTNLTPDDIVILGSSRAWTLSYSPGALCSTGVYVEVTVAGAGTCSFQVLYTQ